MIDMEKLEREVPVTGSLRRAEEVSWINPRLERAKDALEKIRLTMKDVEEADARLRRFAPFIAKAFPGTESAGGIIESPLREIPRMKEALNRAHGARLQGRLLLKMDSELAVAGSVKARGGIYEILEHAENLALQEGVIREGENYEAFAEPRMRAFFSSYAVHVGSTGNLGLSIGIISAALGFRVSVHMSQDAKQWKKDLLRSKGVRVVEYAGDYGEAVKNGRAEAVALAKMAASGCFCSSVTGKAAEISP